MRRKRGAPDKATGGGGGGGEGEGEGAAFLMRVSRSTSTSCFVRLKNAKKQNRTYSSGYFKCS